MQDIPNPPPSTARDAAEFAAAMAADDGQRVSLDELLTEVA